MKIQLIEGKNINPTCNLHGLSLNDYYNLESGKKIEVKKIPDSLKGLVAKAKGAK